MSQFSVTLDAATQSIHVAGDLTFATANDVQMEIQDKLKAVPTITVDLAEVTRSDSAGLALLIDWMRKAKKEDKAITFHNVPQQMIAIAHASGLEELLSLQ